MKLWIGVTDNDWFRFLRSLSGVEEINFWRPGGKGDFKALKPGGLFLFKLHYPENFIVGGGFFVHFTRLPYTLAWEAFGQKNGTRTEEEMRRRIEKYRRSPVDLNSQIGCILLRQPFFFDESQWIPAPEEFRPNIVQGKTFEADSETAKVLWAQVSERLQVSRVWDEVAVPTVMYGDPVLVRPRLGQGTFRVLVTDNYERRCAVTGEKALPVLDAAHILPVGQGGQHQVDNGLLLRTDVHRLFDKGYVTVTPDGRFLVSRRLKDDFDNGEPYMPFNGERIWMPGDPARRPSREALEWHADTLFLR
ncbi:MAG: putative restriction endonuclease [Acidobacteriota bacterium]|jgi:putative restriction endonuclease|nr:putative restriction endonuclease [Acidobacteriota bacterium]